jgi:hypothetical protein
MFWGEMKAFLGEIKNIVVRSGIFGKDIKSTRFMGINRVSGRWHFPPMVIISPRPVKKIPIFSLHCFSEKKSKTADDKLVIIWKTNFDQPPPKNNSIPPKNRSIPPKKQEGSTATTTAAEIVPEAKVPAPASGGADVAAALTHIVNQLDMMRETMATFERRLTMQENVISRLSSEKPSSPS